MPRGFSLIHNTALAEIYPLQAATGSGSLRLAKRSLVRAGWLASCRLLGPNPFLRPSPRSALWALVPGLSPTRT
jgi:hypothetical protein